MKQNNRMNARENNLNSFGNRLKKARIEAGLSQNDLAELSGVSQQMISRLESGKAVGTTQAHRLAKALGVSTDWLLTGQSPTQQAEKSPGNARRFVRKFEAAAAKGALEPRKIRVLEEILDYLVNQDDKAPD